MSGIYGDIVIKNVGFSWASTQVLVEIIGGWDLLTWDEKRKLADIVRARIKTDRAQKAEQKKNEVALKASEIDEIF